MKKYRIYIYDNEEYFDIFDDARQTYVNVHRGFYLQELCDFASMKHKAIVYLREYNPISVIAIITQKIF